LKAHPFFILLSLVLALTSCKRNAAQSTDPNAPVEVVIPEHGAYTGAFMDFGDTEDEVTLEIIEEFEAMVGKHQAIIASSSYWGQQTFPTANLNMIWRHGSLPLLFWSPWDKPYEQERGPDKFGLNEIIAGKWDDYIDKWGEAARAFGKPMIVVFGVEMNGDWFPWSGTFYGGNKPIAGQPNKWEGPESFKAAYRHVVDRVRARGASNIKWMFHTNNYSYPLDNWNFAPAYYPGADYVDWFGLSVYGQQFKDEPWANISSLVDWPYQEICRLDPNKPVMIAEWGTGEFPHSGNKGAWIKQGLDSFRTRYPRVKAAIYWHERWQNLDQSYSNLHVNSSVESLNAYREAVANPAWLGNLILRPIPMRK
jgi:hypothetical protein